jgi:TDG/mug DNA glycosylase family protein
MKLVMVGCNPGDRSARVGHYYAGRNNAFWPLLYESGVLPEELSCNEDKRCIEFGMGLTDLVKRSTRSMAEIEREEFAEGRVMLARKIEEFTPRVVAFNGKTVYEKFAQRTCKLGLQKETIYGAQVFVLPSSSGSNASEKSVKMRYFRQLAELLRNLPD